MRLTGPSVCPVWRPNISAPSFTTRCAFSPGVRAAKFNIVSGCSPVSFLRAGCPGITSHSSGGTQTGFSAFPRLITGNSGRCNSMPYAANIQYLYIRGSRLWIDDSPSLKYWATVVGVVSWRNLTVFASAPFANDPGWYWAVLFCGKPAIPNTVPVFLGNFSSLGR